MRRRAVWILPALLASCAAPATSTQRARRVEPDPAAPVVVELPAQPKKTPHPEEPWAFDVQHYDIHVALDFQRRSLTGRVRITLRDLEDGVPALRLDAAGMTITDVSTLGPESRFTPSTWGIEGDELLVTLPGGSRAGSERQVEVRWQCTPRRGVHFTAPPPGAPEWGRQVWTQGECEDTRWWLPCHDAPNDRATHAIHVTVPDGMTVTAAGRREGVEDTPGPTSTWSFAMDVPHVSYLTTFVAGDLLIGDDSAGPVPLEIVSNARDAAHAATSLGRTTDVLRFFAEYTGRAYPYPRYAQCCVRDFIFGGMENISATTLTDTTVHPPEWGPVKSSDGLVAHEAAHQWFGDLVTCRHWSHIWLNEGFATYFTLLWKEHDEGRDAFLTAVRGTMNGALGACEKARRPVVSDVYAQPFDLFFDGHAYGGGAARLHALRQRLGDATFRDAVRRYVAAQAESVVTTEDFERAVSEAAGEDMRWWFDQWLRSPGRPKLRVRWKWDAEAGALRVTTAQTQDEKGFPQVYRLLLDVACDLRNGRTLSERLDVSTREQEFLIPLPSEPRLVRLDPGRGLLARLDVERGPAEWRALADGDPSPAGRIDALDALVRIARDGKAEKFARERSRDGLLAGLRDPRHDVRRAAVGHLRKIRNVASRDALLGVAANDADPRVRQTAVDALPEWLGDPGVVAALETAYAGDASVHVRAAALRGLARLAAPGVWDRLTEALESTTWQSHLRAAALGSFADLGDERAFPLLVAAAAPGADPWTRDEALAALGRMGRARPDYTEAVLAHLHDPRLAIREAAARALGELRDAGALPALLDAHATEHWPGTLRHLRGAIEKCVKARAEPAPQPAPEPAPQPAPAK